MMFELIYLDCIWALRKWPYVLFASWLVIESFQISVSDHHYCAALWAVAIFCLLLSQSMEGQLEPSATICFYPFPSTCQIFLLEKYLWLISTSFFLNLTGFLAAAIHSGDLFHPEKILTDYLPLLGFQLAISILMVSWIIPTRIANKNEPFFATLASSLIIALIPTNIYFHLDTIPLIPLLAGCFVLLALSYLASFHMLKKKRKGKNGPPSLFPDSPLFFTSDES